MNVQEKSIFFNQTMILDAAYNFSENMFFCQKKTQKTEKKISVKVFFSDFYISWKNLEKNSEEGFSELNTV